MFYESLLLLSVQLPLVTAVNVFTGVFGIGGTIVVVLSIIACCVCCFTGCGTNLPCRRQETTVVIATGQPVHTIQYPPGGVFPQTGFVQQPGFTPQPGTYPQSGSNLQQPTLPGALPQPSHRGDPPPYYQSLENTGNGDHNRDSGQEQLYDEHADPSYYLTPVSQNTEYLTPVSQNTDYLTPVSQKN